MTLTARSTLGHDSGVCHSLSVSTGMSLSEQTDIGCVWLTCATDASAVLEPLEAALGFDLPRESGAMMRTGDYSALWMNPRAWLLRCPSAAETEIVARVALAFPDRLVHASTFTDFLCWFSLEGIDAENALKQGGFVSLSHEGLREGHAKRTLMSGVPVVLFRETKSVWRVGVERSRGPYFRDWLTSLDILPGEQT